MGNSNSCVMLWCTTVFLASNTGVTVLFVQETLFGRVIVASNLNCSSKNQRLKTDLKSP
jgi:hypothetical protein